MARKKTEKPSQTIARLVALADSENLASGYFDDDVQDEMALNAKVEADELNKDGVESQIRFLLEQGFEADRLEELIREGATKPT